MQQLLTSDATITYDYDSVQDMLYILFEPVKEATFYEDVPNQPGIMLRYSVSEERVVGITVHNVANRLPPDMPQDVATRHLAQKLVNQLR